MARRDAGTAHAYVEGDFIKISVRISWLKDTVRDSINAGYLPTFSETGVKLTDPTRFAQDVCNALNHEKEDGTTPVHELFDEAFEQALENGSTGVEWPRKKAR